MTYPKRLIEVDLPIKRISAHARREKSIRHGHISTLHIWWARRPLAACRAVICAALWPDPADPSCPEAFVTKAREVMLAWTAHERQTLLSPESRVRFEKARQKPALFKDAIQLRGALLDFIADFANWDNSTVPEYLATSRALTQAAHEALGGAPGTRPLVVDPFCGGGSIPLEALRVGADAFASDLNPVPVLLNKVILEYIPKYGQRLADEVRKWGEWIKRDAEKELAEFYPKDPDGGTPIAYLWARTIQCEGPGCGAEVPLIRALWLAKKANRSVALQLVPRPRAKRVDFQIIVKQRGGWVDQDDPKTKIEDPKFDGTVKRGSATCPCCGYTTPVARVRQQLKARRGGANDARLMCVVTEHPKETMRLYRLAGNRDLKAVLAAATELERRRKAHNGEISLVPDEPTPKGGGSGAGRAFSQRNYGMDTFADLFTARQLLAITTLAQKVRAVGEKLRASGVERGFAEAVQTLLAQVVNKQADYDTSLCSWHYHNREKVNHTFHRQAIPIVWDFVEPVFFGDGAGSWAGLFDWTMQAVENPISLVSSATVNLANAAAHPLPTNSAQAFVTDPPYYDAVPYSDLSDFFYVWFKRSLPGRVEFSSQLTPKEDECIVDEVKGKDRAYFEATMKLAMTEGRRVLSPDGIGIVVFAHKSTAGWEAQLQAMIDAGWIMTGSWPIDTEMGTRLRAHESAALASSVHLVCRPRENPDGSVRTDEIGDWRDVLQELPRRIHDWMPRLAEEGVVGADAIFACLGPALEIFSRHSRVEKASGEAVTLKEYLEQVWAAVAKEALTMIFTGADATGFEEDARLTAMWLWTLKTGDASGAEGESAEDDSGDDEEGSGKKGGGGGFVLEFDAARKIAQGLGAHLEDLTSLVEVSGETARLLPVAERARTLFGKGEGKAAPVRRKRDPQMDLFKALQADDDTQTSFGDTKVESVGNTALDRVHQSMILFAAGRSEALKRFLVEDGAGRDARFWTLAQALSALYPVSTDEKRWVDGVLARKKGLGF
jgi:adenine-specific DNA methylase